MSMEENDDSKTPASDACYQKTEQNPPFPMLELACSKFLLAKALAPSSSTGALVGPSNFPTDYSVQSGKMRLACHP
jgi:hypothetical protein